MPEDDIHSGEHNQTVEVLNSESTTQIKIGDRVVIELDGHHDIFADQIELIEAEDVEDLVNEKKSSKLTG